MLGLRKATPMSGVIVAAAVAVGLSGFGPFPPTSAQAASKGTLTIKVTGLPKGTPPVSVSCRDSVDPGGFYTFTMTTNGSGYAFTQNQCYSGDHPDHWVIAGGVASNHVQW
jgi:hypothetical protein